MRRGLAESPLGRAAPFPAAVARRTRRLTPPRSSVKRFAPHRHLASHRPLLLSSTIRRDNVLMAVDLTNPDLYVDGRIVLPRGTLHLNRSRLIWHGVCYELIRIRNFALSAVNIDLEPRRPDALSRCLFTSSFGFGRGVPVRVRNLAVLDATLDLTVRRHARAVAVDVERRSGQVEGVIESWGS